MTRRLVLCLTLPLCCAGLVSAEDWPEWRGRGRTGVWNETGIVEAFPEGGLKPVWRTPVRAGYSGPAVAAGRVYLTDFEKTAGTKGKERALCLDEKSGAVLWTREWDADYRGISYGSGPRATPTVDGDRVYVLGGSGILHCLNSRTGEAIWRKDYVRDYGAQLPVWGIAGAPVVDGARLIAVVGGQPDAKVMAFDKMTGKEMWRALASDSEQGYSQPILTGAGGVRQLIVWHTRALASIEPATGKVNWEQPFRVHLNTPVATPVASGAMLLISSFYNGSMLLELAGAKSRVLWRGKSESEIRSDGLHALVNTPAIDGGHIYGICSYGQFRCIDLKTGERVWETQAVTKENARWATGFLVRQGGRWFINNDRGELIMAKLSPRGYEEVGRAALIKPTSNPGNRRELGAVNWTHPAYANRHVIARNDEEVISVSLAEKR